MNKTQLAKELGISRRMVYKLIDQGMPSHSVEAAKHWRNQNLDYFRTINGRIDGNQGKRAYSQPAKTDDEILDEIEFDLGDIDDDLDRIIEENTKPAKPKFDLKTEWQRYIQESKKTTG